MLSTREALAAKLGLLSVVISVDASSAVVCSQKLQLPSSQFTLICCCKASKTLELISIYPPTYLYTMFEARLVTGIILKQVIDAVKDLVNDANLDCSEEEVSIQCMDSSHVSLVAVSLQAAAFDHFRCDRPLSLGINSQNMAKIFKMMGKEDVVVLKADDEPDNLTLMFESTKSDTIADFGKMGVEQRTL